MLGKVKLEDATVLEMDTRSSPYDPNDGFTATLLLPSLAIPMHVSLRDDKIFNLPILTKLAARWPWRKHLPREYLSNVWLLATNDEETITASGAIDTLNFVRQHNRTTWVIQFHKRTTYSETLVNEHRSIFD